MDEQDILNQQSELIARLQKIIDDLDSIDGMNAIYLNEAKPKIHKKGNDPKCPRLSNKRKRSKRI